MEDTQQVKTEYQIVETKASAFGGAFVLAEFLKRIKFHSLFKSIFKHLRRIRKYRPSDNIALLMALIIEGGERLYDIKRFTDDQVIAELFEVADIPEDTTIRDDLVLLGQKNEERQELLFQLNEMLFERLKLHSLTIDIDATALPVDGHQQEAEKGYCPTEPGSRCFQSLKAICDETETTIAEQTFAGNTHCAKHIIEFVKMILDRFADHFQGINLTVRLDAGFYSDNLLKFLESYSNVIYEVSVPKHAWLQDKLERIAYRKYYDSEREYSSFAYGEGLDGAFRYYYVERRQKQDEQINLFESFQYSYRVIVSNKRRLPHTAFRDYNGRARIEKHIEELKNQYALGKMVSGDFAVTKALVWLSHLTFTIMGMLRAIAFRRQMAKYRLRRLRFILFSAIGYFTEHARKRKFNIALSRVGLVQFNMIMQRIWAF
jgi:hypothetical protein